MCQKYFGKQTQGAGIMNLKDKLIRDYPQMSEIKIDQIIKESEREVEADENNRERES